jgi:hypothetical protein
MTAIRRALFQQRLKAEDPRSPDQTPRLRDGSGRVGFWKFLPDPLGFGLPRTLTRPGLGGFPTLKGRASLVLASSLILIKSSPGRRIGKQRSETFLKPLGRYAIRRIFRLSALPFPL